ncbi:hypothetical protein [Actinokineospora sp. NBRC 105648]|uniref:hypothetical protein n=1 Tax=Actinokineospora sp. NBRC 105648 TaxID=3032206 RepID=UPI0024A0B390|nr:hypothetical protein [Actinokineospora sp. NBRC 105648]GLZ41685.1 hypothetical protein Acsp05_53090 [Actinokineospora sp. NBRC 105648]
MTSFSLRYARGQRESVWSELRALGPVPEELAEDVAAVADETMRRVSQHVARIAAALPELGWTSSDRLIAPHQPPTDGDQELVSTLSDKIGGLPFALEACLRRVGEVWFAGDCEALLLTYHHEPTPSTKPPGAEYPDPLCLGNAYFLDLEWQDIVEEEEDPEGFEFCLAPDELLKANISGGSHYLELPSQVADPVLVDVAGRPGITLVDYLRESVRWGGFPGYSFEPDLAPAALITLRTEPDF